MKAGHGDQFVLALRAVPVGVGEFLALFAYVSIERVLPVPFRERRW